MVYRAQIPEESLKGIVRLTRLNQDTHDTRDVHETDQTMEHAGKHGEEVGLEEFLRTLDLVQIFDSLCAVVPETGIKGLFPTLFKKSIYSGLGPHGY